MKRASQNGILRPFAAIIAVIGVVTLVIVGIRALTARSEKDAAPIEPQARQLQPAPAPVATPRRRGLLRRHPLVIALIAVAVVVVGTLAYIPFSGWSSTSTIGGIPHEPSEYDKFFTYSQMESMARFAKCDAMLFSTTPELELENVKERMSIETEFDSSAGSGASGQAGISTRRVRTPEEIAETIRLAEEYYDRINCMM